MLGKTHIYNVQPCYVTCNHMHSWPLVEYSYAPPSVGVAPSLQQPFYGTQANSKKITKIDVRSSRLDRKTQKIPDTWKHMIGLHAILPGSG